MFDFTKPTQPRGLQDLAPWQTATCGLRRATVVGCVALVLAILAGSTWQVWHLRRSAIDAAQRTTATYSIQLAEQTARLFQAADLILHSTDDFLRLAPATRLADVAGMNMMLREKIAGVPEIQGHTVLGADGVPRFSSRPNIPHVSFADRSYFKVQAASPSAGLFISELRANRADGSLAIFMSRRVNRANGQFGGVIGVTIEPKYLVRLFHSASPGPGFTIVLLRSDGRVLASDPVWLMDQASGPAGTRAGDSAGAATPGDIGSVQPVAGYPLRLAMTADKDAILAEWRGIALVIMGCAALGAAIIVLLSWILLRQLISVDEGRRQLWKSEATLRLIFDTVPIGIQIKDLKGRVLMVNPELARIIRATPDQVLGRPSHEVSPLPEMPEQERRIILETDGEAIRTGKPVDFDLDRAFPDGMRKFRIIKSSIQDDRGAASGVLLIVEDVTEKARTRGELETSRKLMQNVIDNLPQAITVKDCEGKYVLANIVAARFRGQTPDRYLGRTVKDMGQSPENIRLLEETDRLVLQSGAMQVIPEMKFAGAGQMDVWRRTFKIPLMDESGAVTHILTVHEDLSAIREMEGKRLELERRMAQSRKLESLGVMAGGIAHDFNNLLTTISGSAEYLVNGLPPGDALTEDARTIVKASQVMAEMIRQMLTFSQNGQLQLQRVDLNATLKDAGGLLHSIPPEHIEVRYELAANLPAVEGDPSQLNRVVANLVTNAVEAIGDKPGTITLSSGVVRVDEAQIAAADTLSHLAQGEYVYFQVADTGVGMADDVKTRMFEPFFTTKFKGRGMGMAAASGIIRSHQGVIVIESQPGRGTTMRVLLPRPKEDGSIKGSLDLGLLPAEPAGRSLI